MRRTVRGLSEAETRDLAAGWNVDVDERDAAAIREDVNDRLDGLDDIYEITVPGPEVSGSRAWDEPADEENQYNAIVTRCEVPPAGDGPLSGLTVGLKDNIAVAGVPMSCGSAAMEGFVPLEDATVVPRLRAAGATITAKTNLDEFAAGARGSAHDGSILHPADIERYPGGSSGGSAAAVLADHVDVALGTDTGGSVRAPAALCGLVGVKPTYGLVPLTGVIENTYSLDHVGVITETVAEAGACLEAIVGKDERDPASMAAAGSDSYRVGGYVEAAENPIPLEELTVGLLIEAFDGGQPDVISHVDAVLDGLDDAGVAVVDVSLPESELVDSLKNCITCPELAQYWRDGGVPLRRGGGGESRDQVGFARRTRAASGELNQFFRGRILTGARLLTAHDGRHYSRALAARRVVREKTADELDELGADALVCPTVPGIAPRHVDADDPGFGITANTRLANVTEQPGFTVPCGTVDGLPVGLHLLGRRFDERTLFRIAASLEREL